MIRTALLGVLAALPLVPALPAQDGYRLPPEEVLALVDAPLPPSVELSPDGRWAAFVERDAMPALADVARRMLRLAGMRIDPAANARFASSFARSVAIRETRATEAEPVRVALPDGARVADVSWSRDSRHFVVTIVTDDGSELWGGTADAPETVRRLVPNLSTVTGGPQWHPDGVRVLCRTVPADRGEEPAPPRVAAGPIVQETTGEESPTRTYQDLLRNPHDADLFDHYATCDLTLVSVADGAKAVVASGVHRDAEISPDGEWLFEVLLERPYSYLLPMSSFPQRVQVRPLAGGGEPIVLAEIPQEANVPIGGVRTGPRSFTWMASAPATLCWAEALDGGDPKVEVPHRDRWLALEAPFEADARELLRVEERARGLEFLADAGQVLASEYDRDRRWTRTLLHELGGTGSPKVLEDRSIRDRYGDPGRLLTEPGPFGPRVVRVEDGAVYRTGSGASPEGDLPFLRRQDLATLETTELWRCAPGAYERVVDVLEADERGAMTFVTMHEDPTSPPNLRLRTAGSAEFVALTDFPDPTPQLRGVTTELVTYEREDGVPLSATLYLPAGYEEGTRLPLVVWAYPREFNDAATASQISGSPWRFTTVRGTSHLSLLTQGYAVLDGATMPIIGDILTMNDTFRPQLVAAARAAVDFAVERGVADRERTVVGGHSYGAFMTANLLAHSDVFRAGIARSGAYNRTLTPFGFQSEQRTFWEAPETYFAVSPFMHADKIDEPILLIHGEEDNNSGTFPMQSRRMFQALEGHGATARLVMLPHESHGYRGRESVLHVQAEMVDWCDRYVKNAAPRPAEEEVPESTATEAAVPVGAGR